MARDWNFIRERFPELHEDPTYDEVLQHVRDRYRASSLTELADALEGLEDEREPHDEALAGIDAVYLAIEQVTTEKLVELDLESVKTSTGGKFSIDKQIDAVKVDNLALVKWIKQHEMDEVLSVHGQTLSAMVRRRVENGEEVPDGVQVKNRDKLKFAAPRKARRK